MRDVLYDGETKTPELPDPQEVFWLELGPAEPEDTAAQQSVLPYADPALRPYPDAGVSDDPQQPVLNKRGRPILGRPVVCRIS